MRGQDEILPSDEAGERQVERSLEHCVPPSWEERDTLSHQGSGCRRERERGFPFPQAGTHLLEEGDEGGKGKESVAPLGQVSRP